jgi:Alpha-(1->3)-arabinofuranosyltransferase
MKHIRVGSWISWAWLFMVLVSLALLPALTRNIAALAYDAAMEHVPRGVVFSQAISDGILYPRWTQLLHWGLGSPLFTFQPPLPYYGLDLLYRLGIPHPLGWRLLIALGLLAAFSGAYLLVRTVTGQRWPAIVAGVAYLYAPYVLRNSLERGSNEAYSMFLYPWVLWGLIWVARGPSPGRFVVATLLWAACIASHVLAPLILLPFALLLAAYLTWHRRSWTPLGVLVAGGLLAAAVWMPMIPEQRFVQVERDFTHPEAIPARNPISLGALLAPPAIYDTASDNNDSGDRAGIAGALILIAGIPGAAIAAARRRRTLALALGASTVAGILVFWMLTSASDPIWNMPGVGVFLARLLYRTRLMGLLSLAVACTAGLFVALLSTRWQRIAGLLLAASLIVVALPSLYLELQYRYGSFASSMSLAEVRATEIATGGKALTAFGEFTPRWRDAPFDESLLQELGSDHDPLRKPLRNATEEIEVQSANVASGAWDLDVMVHPPPEQGGARPTTATFYLLYYPRWRARVDGQPTELRPEPGTGYAQLDLPAENHRVSLRYGPTTAEIVGLLVSGLTLLILLGAAAWVLLRRARSRDTTATAGSSDSGKADRPGPRGAGGVAPPVWLLLGATALVLVKFAYMDSATTWLRCTSTPDRVCGAEATVDIPFSEGPRLRGYTVPSYQVKAGDKLRVTLYWQIDGPVEQPAASFVHLLGPTFNPRTNNPLWGQQEKEAPGGHTLPRWTPGKVYRDAYEFQVDPATPAGEYSLEIGWFLPESGERLKLAPECPIPARGLRLSDLDSLLIPGIIVR